ISPASMRTTFAPRSAARRAAEHPVKPPPMTTRSADRRPSSGGAATSSRQVARQRFPTSSDVKANPLRQRELVRIVDRVGGAAHVGPPCVRAAFAAAAGLLFTTERAADLGAGRPDID